MIIDSTFEPAWWLRNAHLQTIYPYLAKNKNIQNPIEVEHVELSDGDFIELIWSNGQLDKSAPLVILLHGLGGNFRSHYVQKLFYTLNQSGMRCVLMHFRGAGENPNRSIRCYHAGDTDDFNRIVHHLHKQEPLSEKMALGVSLGGGVLLKWLCENGTQPWIKKAFALSVPFQLDVSVECVSKGFAKVYQTHMLSALKNAYVKKMQKFSFHTPFSLNQILPISDFYTFDNTVTAPVFGFKNADQYYKLSSCRQYLSGIHTPTLILHALDDPLMNTSVLPRSHQLSKEVTLELSQSGGHVGFFGVDSEGGMQWWPEQRIINFFKNA